MQFTRRRSKTSKNKNGGDNTGRGKQFWADWEEAHSQLFAEAVASAEGDDNLTVEEYTEILRIEAWELSKQWGLKSYRNGVSSGLVKAGSKRN